MPETLTVNIARDIVSAEIWDNGGSEQTVSGQGAEGGKGDLSGLCEVLNGVVEKLNSFYEKVFFEHREQIAKLSVGIARKILMQEVEEGNYQIESIVKEAIKNSPTRHNMVVHLNPEDFSQYQKQQKENPDNAVSGVEFVTDPNIGPAECLLETLKAIIEA